MRFAVDVLSGDQLEFVSVWLDERVSHPRPESMTTVGMEQLFLVGPL